MYYAQVLTDEQARAYTSTVRTAGIDPLRVSGFVVGYSDIATLRPGALVAAVNAAHPDVHGIPVTYPSDHVMLLVFAAGANARICTTPSTSVQMGGTVDLARFDPPFTGNGFAGGSGDPVAESLVDAACLLPPGAQVRRVDTDGSHQVVAILGAAEDGSPRWQTADEISPAPVSQQQGEHELFIELGGHALPAIQVNEDMIGVLAPDSRAAWLCHPGADVYVTVTSGCMSLYSLDHVDSVHRLETRTVWRGLTCVVEGLTPDSVSLLRIGRPDVALASAGFLGDQYHGFRAVLPRSEVPSVTIDLAGLTPGIRPRRQDTDAPFVEGENRRFHETFISEEDKGPLPLWSAPGPDGNLHDVLRAPDARALSLMAPGVETFWRDADGGVLVSLEEVAPDARRASALTRVRTDDGALHLVEGVDGQLYVGNRVEQDRISPDVERIPPARVVSREDALFQTG